jgi:hypothetical protein
MGEITQRAGVELLSCHYYFSDNKLIFPEHRRERVRTSNVSAEAHITGTTGRGIAQHISRRVLSRFPVKTSAPESALYVFHGKTKKMVGAKGFEPSASWSRTRFQSLWKSLDTCCFLWFENKPFAAGHSELLKFEGSGGFYSYKIIYSDWGSRRRRE